MHILHITPYYAPAWAFGGVVSAVTGLATEQARGGHRVTVLTTDALDATHRQRSRREQLDGVTVIRARNVIPAARTMANLSTPWGFSALVRAIAADVLHVHELRTVENLLTPHLAPLICSPHGTLSHTTGRSALKRGWDAVVGRRIARKIDHIAALTRTEAEEADAIWQILGLAAPATTIIPNGVQPFPLELLTRRRARAAGRTVLFLGRLQARKGILLLLQAFASVAEAFPDARLIVAGPDEGMLSAALELTSALGLTQRVTFTGLLDRTAKQAVLVAADVFALPAVGEGLSMSMLEAMSAEIPVLITPGCNLPDVEQRGAGILVEQNVAAIAEGLMRLVRNPDDLRRIGTQARTWIDSEFTWQVVAEQLDRVYASEIARYAQRARR